MIAVRSPFHGQPMPMYQHARIALQLELADAVLERELITVGAAMAATYVDAGYALDAPDLLPAGGCCGVYTQSLIAREESLQ